MNKDTLLLIIDMQNDFCKPGGSLYVKGATDDVSRLAGFISANSAKIDHIIMTQDNHHVVDISHPVFWEDGDGAPPPPFTIITSHDIDQGKWKPGFDACKARDYIRMLEQQGEYPHTIWPEHCIIGSVGAAIVDEIMEPVKAWARRGNFYDVVVKGSNPLTEHFGALRANVIYGDSPETQLNTTIVNKLKAYRTILVAGEARSHCVAATVGQMLEIDGIAGKMVILDDCMSDITGFESLARPIYREAGMKGTQFTTSTLYRFGQ